MNGARGLNGRFSMNAGLLALAAMIVVVGCAPPRAQESPELTAALGLWEQHFNAGDAEALASIYTKDCRIMPPGAKLMEGRDSVAAAFRKEIASGVKIELKPIQTIAAGDLGSNVGLYTVRTPNGAVTERGKYMEAWRKTADGWKIANDIWNSDAPAAPAGATMIFTHKVKDATRWLAAWQGKDGRRKQFAEHGVSGVRVFQDPHSPRRTALLVTVADAKAFQAFLSSPEVETAKAEDGVIEATLRNYTEVK